MPATSRAPKATLTAVLAALLSALAFTALPPTPANADTPAPPEQLTSTTGEVFSWPPAAITLPAAADTTSIALTGSDGTTYEPTGTIERTQSGIQVLLPHLEDGQYQITWKEGDNRQTRGFEIDAVFEESPGYSTTAPPQSSPIQAGTVILAALVLGGAGAVIVVPARRTQGGLRAAILSTAALGTASIFALLLTQAAQTQPADNYRACANQPENVRAACLVPAIVAAYTSSPEESHQLMLAIEQDPLMAGRAINPCHEATHAAARLLVRSGSDPAELVKGAPATACGMGFRHGTMEGYALIATDTVFAEFLPNACSDISDRDPGQRVECSHGAGHAAGYRHNLDLPAAIHDCAQAAPHPEERVQCIAGAGMTVGVSVANQLARDNMEAANLARWKGKAPLGICLTLHDKERMGCMLGLAAYLDLNPETVIPAPFRPVDAWESCAGQPAEVKRQCAFAIGGGVSDAGQQGTQESQIGRCSAIDQQYRQHCIAGAVFWWQQTSGTAVGTLTDQTQLTAVCNSANLTRCPTPEWVATEGVNMASDSTPIL